MSLVFLGEGTGAILVRPDNARDRMVLAALEWYHVAGAIWSSY